MGGLTKGDRKGKLRGDSNRMVRNSNVSILTERAITPLTWEYQLGCTPTTITSLSYTLENKSGIWNSNWIGS